MRELQSTKAIFDQALRKAQAGNAVRIKSVQLVLGEIAELDPDMIQEHWVELSRGTPLEHAPIHFRPITARVQCMACFKKYHPENGTIQCPHCGSFGAKILAGEEFHFESIEVDDE